MKRLSPIIRQISLFLFVGIMTGCATTAHVSIDHIATENAIFIVSNDNDPIGVASVISEEISKRGYQVHIVHPRQKTSNQEPLPVAAFGSGFFISEDGMIISNAHVVKGASSIIVRTINDETFKAKILVTDEKNDIAILQPLESQKVTKWLTLSPFRKGANLGEKIRIIGYPLSDLLGKQPRVTEGIISAEVGLLDDPTRFQVSASIQPGNSGGPILNDDYQVVGIATEKLSDLYAVRKTGSIPQNVNFGVKADYARMLFSSGIEKSIAVNAFKVESLKDAVGSTVLVAVNVEDIPEIAATSSSNRRVLITYSYNYSWDVFHYTLSRFNMQWVDENSGEILANGNFSGASFLSYVGIVQGVITEVFNKAGM
mgnify:CR=1 FL=1